MEYQTITPEQIKAETVAIAEIRARLKIAMQDLRPTPLIATPQEAQELRHLIDTRKNTKVFLLSTEWGKANPPPRDFRITLAKAWPDGKTALLAGHISWFRQALLHSEEKSPRPAP